MSTSPTNTVSRAILFTDIEGSTGHWERDPEAMRVALVEHDRILREAVADHGGEVFKTMGDAFCVVFGSAAAAALCAVDAQRALLRGSRLKVRMAISSGDVAPRDGDYFGPPVNRAARLLSIAHGGQVVVGSATAGPVADSLLGAAALRDLGLYRLRGIDEPERVYQIVHPDLPAEFAPLNAPRPVVANLPGQLAAFVGRETQIGAWREAIADPNRRLVTLTGFGGIGKTRSAMQLAERCLDAFADGVWWCEQEEARTGDAMWTLLGTQLRVPLQPTRTAQAQVVEFVRDRELLVVLDNTEQVADATVVVRDLLRDAPKVKCLVTSRRALELRGETVFELPPLSDDEAVDLFVARASECLPTFTLTPENRPDIVALCRGLEGIPLAIELAAARIVGMAPRQILQRLGERFRLLQSRSPSLPARQRALRGAIDWSYELLNPSDREAFAQLSVFAGGFTMDDAEAVCDTFDIFESVLELRRHSFFRIETDPESQETRFHLLELLREYGAERLAETTEIAMETRRRHARHFLAFASERLARFRTAGEPEALKELKRNTGNLRVAAESARLLGDPVLGGELALARGRMSHRLGVLHDALAAIEEGFSALGAPDPATDGLRARLLEERAGLHFDFREADAAREKASAAQAIFERLGDVPGQARARNLLGQVALLERDFETARTLFREMLDRFQEVGDPVGMAIAQNNLGLAERRDHTGEPEAWDARAERAERHFAEALRLRRERDDRRGIAETVNNLGVLAHEWAERLLGRPGVDDAVAAQWDLAWRRYGEAILVYEQLDDTLGIGYCLANLGEVAENRRDWRRAVGLYALAIRLLEAVNAPILDAVRPMLARAAEAAGVPLPGDGDDEFDPAAPLHAQLLHWIDATPA